MADCNEAPGGGLLEKILLVILGILIVLAVIGLPTLFFLTRERAARAADAAPVAVVIEPTIPTLTNAAPIVTTTSTLRATVTPWNTIQPVTSPDPTQKAEDQKELNDFIISENWAEAITLLDHMLAETPDDAELLYLRARAYFRLYPGLRSQAEGMQYIQRGLQDIDKSISFSKPDGEKYYVRAHLYADMAYLMDYRVDRDYLERITIDNMVNSIQLGNHDGGSASMLLYLYFDIADCNNAFSMLEKVRSQGAEDYALQTYQAVGLVTCERDYAGALEAIDRAFQTHTSTRLLLLKSMLLYYLDRKEEALAILDQLIENNPQFNGDRYYLRALIHYEMGQKEEAAQDLELGAGNTWYHGGLYLYVQAMQAFDRGDREEGIWLLQEAEATQENYDLYGPFIDKFQQELKKYGASPLDIPVSVPYQSTPIVLPQE